MNKHGQLKKKINLTQVASPSELSISTSPRSPWLLWVNVDPGVVNPGLFIWGCFSPVLMWGIQTTFGGAFTPILINRFGRVGRELRLRMAASPLPSFGPEMAMGLALWLVTFKAKPEAEGAHQPPKRTAGVLCFGSLTMAAVVLFVLAFL